MTVRIAVLGGGTAGCMAAAHISKYFPDAQLLHIYDSQTPIIGVGEGSTPNVARWWGEVTGLGFPELRSRCNATLKHGTQFENWGQSGKMFQHHFQPAGTVAYHLDAQKLVVVLREYVKGERLDARVSAMHSDGVAVDLVFGDGTTRRFDYVFDARGFPRAGDEDTITMDWIPTNAATVRRTLKARFRGWTRAIARPHGWIFAIPLEGDTAYGYIHNQDLSPPAQVEADLESVFFDEQIDDAGEPLRLRFPSYVRRTATDGALFRIGNAYSFVEPIEAVSIGTALVYLRAATRFIGQNQDTPRTRPDPQTVAAFNESMLSYVLANSLFISWHYLAGSRFRSPFWEHAVNCFGRAAQRPELVELCAEFARYRAVAREFPVAELLSIADRKEWNERIYPKLQLFRPFGNFSELNVAQVGHGIGLFEVS